MKTNLKLDLESLFDSVCGEVDLMSYFVKLQMRDYKIPVEINPMNISWQPFEVTSGQLDWHIDAETMTMEIEYVA
ncbi:hypothetical protein PHG31p45 [Aeromonas phage 31]|uniref:Uncharacterized protein n=4 Tax=Biquartavirus TaxID=1912143 RepID=Q6U9Q6_9CAUD|nr:hypothetical protein ST44RRORF046c [Aeromonas phage 44RR2.8t]YP_238774.1 hypothetical protein PHG31p45 [Aeromonas phage 31]APU00940.1 hypothetical protein [Aeromonas phage 31.2]UYD59609.1 hypothetical protein JNMOADIG_00080 [Aeromonas phage avDM5]UYD60417.1 hypothetical protein NPHMPGLK_00082 [Aeromonas phage avDM2]AAQ81365.1 hypothetical protein [Aeromonas phage 44RR2.8t]AAX63534.1 hypothetical protein PHG31p45 [Aeromonas phage 31]